jgi:hypothetical protein
MSTNYSKFVDEMADMDADLVARDPVAAAARPTERELQAMSEADSRLEQAREAVDTAIRARLAASEVANAIEARELEEAVPAGIRLGNLIPGRNLRRGARLEAALDEVEHCKVQVQDAQDAFERTERTTREAHARVSASRSARRATADAAYQKKYAAARKVAP